MARKNISIDEETIELLKALSGGDLAPYADDSKAIREAVRRLHALHFNPTSAAPDDVLERLRVQPSVALGTVEGELERRSNADD